MPTPHKHAALIKQWADDQSQDVWFWDAHAGWVHDDEPTWLCVHYALGPKPTQPPRNMCTLAGVEFKLGDEVDVPDELVGGTV